MVIAMFPRYRPLAPLLAKSKKTQLKIEPESEARCSSSESDDLEVIYRERPSFENYAYPNDYWKFQKSIKYLAYGRPLITALALITAYDCNFQDPIMLSSLKDCRFIELLLNFLHSKDKRIQTVSMRFLRKLSKIRTLRYEIVYLGGVQSMASLLSEAQMDLKEAGARAIACMSDFHKAWVEVRKADGITRLVKMIYLPKQLLCSDPSTLSDQLNAVLFAAEAAAEALFMICQCRKNQMEFLLSGALKGCQDILQTSHTRLCTLVLKIIERCATQKLVRLAIKNLGMLDDFRKHFYSADQNLVQAAALAAFKCAESKEDNTFFRKIGFIDKLYEIIQTSAFHSDFELMASIAGAMWKCAENEENVQRMQTLNCAPLLIQLLSSQPEHVQEHLVACISCCMRNPQIRTVIRKNNGIEALIELLLTTHPPLIMHLNKALAGASNDPECLVIMEKHNALRLIWSHLKNDDPSVVANTAWQLSSILKNIKNSSVYVRSLVGSVQVLMECLHRNHTRVSTSVCALIVVLCRDKYNRRILTDYQVVDNLSKLTNTKCRRLRYHLCMAITACCPFNNNREEFANRRVVYPLIRMLKSKSPVVKGAATLALQQLAHIPRWCAIMYNCPDVYETLLEEMKSKDKEVQECSADIIQKMRLFALNRDGNIPRWLIEKHSTFFSN